MTGDLDIRTVTLPNYYYYYILCSRKPGTSSNAKIVRKRNHICKRNINVQIIQRKYILRPPKYPPETAVFSPEICGNKRLTNVQFSSSSTYIVLLLPLSNEKFILLKYKSMPSTHILFCSSRCCQVRSSGRRRIEGWTIWKLWNFCLIKTNSS